MHELFRVSVVPSFLLPKTHSSSSIVPSNGGQPTTRNDDIRTRTSKDVGGPMLFRFIGQSLPRAGSHCHCFVIEQFYERTKSFELQQGMIDFCHGM